MILSEINNRIVFRADASVDIGSGHVMRCLTLAEALRVEGKECHFICREHKGNLIGRIKAGGYKVHTLPFDTMTPAGVQDDESLPHAGWLGVSWQQDAEESCRLVDTIDPAWLVVDHYALDKRWETNISADKRKVMVIDDLADRFHDCDILLDQTLGRLSDEYISLVPPCCCILTGIDNALLRPEFRRLRSYSLERRSRGTLKRILITMGGVDQYNMTGRILSSIDSTSLKGDVVIDIVLGPASPWIEEIHKQTTHMRTACNIHVDTDRIAELMCEADIAIGASGGTSWERCCLGLPSLTIILAENQRVIAERLSESGASLLAGNINEPGVEKNIVEALCMLQQHPATLRKISARAAEMTNGLGIQRVVDILGSYSAP